ncbi:DUF3592 domain-containing protein [Bacteroidales bacterium OttesenSCG-928-B11]|nr:DUF3592 domain-containing protein [Bacteroidales bacterium OttesenSCG-928-C03]MDL2311386.1 DUF3592 domain-containing protein [Bacteroidales bacterium OttesenSCG-928-B11]MDL2325782.1 DUF3592 domain-containing protein [Bacteroidales bacterium OttesenSCG-928-A14]
MKRIFIILVIIGIVAFIIFGFWIDNRSSRNAQEKVGYLLRNGNCCIGSIAEIRSSHLKGGSYLSSVVYEYQINNEKLENTNGLQTIKAISKEAERRLNYDLSKGERFLVVYDPANPENSLLLLDRPIEKEGDFERYVKEMEQMRNNNGR